MHKVLSLILILVISSMIAKAQHPHMALYAELGGPGLASLNFDTRFSNRNDGLGGRIGVGGFSIDEVTAIYVPIGLNYLIGKGDRHYFEFGAGGTYVDYRNDDAFDNTNDGIFERSFGYVHLGYRIQPKEGGFLFRAAIIPIFGNGNFIPYYAGVSFGYKF